MTTFFAVHLCNASQVSLSILLSLLYFWWALPRLPRSSTCFHSRCRVKVSRSLPLSFNGWAQGSDAAALPPTPPFPSVQCSSQFLSLEPCTAQGEQHLWVQEAALDHPAAPDLLPKQPPAAPTAWPRLQLTKNLWGREEQSTVVPTHSPVITQCFTSSIICLHTQGHAASCDQRELAVPLLENFPFSLPKYF